MTYGSYAIKARLQVEGGRAVIEDWDSHWEEVMELAQRYGFIVQAYAGTATLATNAEQIEQLGLDGKATLLRASGLVGRFMGDE